jgi:hypothetical protein
MGLDIQRFLSDNGQQEYNNISLRSVLTACSTTFMPCLLSAQHANCVAERNIHTITEIARVLQIDTQFQAQFCPKVVKEEVCLNQRSSKTVLTAINIVIGSQAQYEK